MVIACQCNGHSQCDDNNQCIFCEHNTTGNKCETCKPGYFGDPSNGGTCQRKPLIICQFLELYQQVGVKNWGTNLSD